jgi:hypothetical protein
VPAGEQDYDGVQYADLVLAEIDWSEIGDHDPARRGERKGTTEHGVETEWATEACQDPARLARSAGSRSGMTAKVTGRSASAGFIVTVIVAPKDFPPAERWWGATAWKANSTEVREYEER